MSRAFRFKSASSYAHLPSFRRTALAAAISGLSLTPTLILAAAPGPVGAEFQVNTATALAQLDTKIAMDANGDFVVVWTHQFSATDRDIRAQRYSANGQAVGSEFVVAGTGANESQPSVSMDASGNFVVAWTLESSGNREIRAQRYNAAGVTQGGTINVNTVTTNIQDNPAIALDADGDFVIAWESYASGNNDIRAQRYNAAGVAQGSEFTVNTVTASIQSDPAIGLDADGDFVVAWSSYLTGGGVFDIRAQRYNAAGVAQGSEFTVNNVIADDQSDPAIALAADGDFVVAWNSFSAGDPEIRARRYSAAGVALGGEFAVNTVTANIQAFPAIALDADGDFVIAWESYASGNPDIRAQRYNAAGLAQGGEFAVNTVATDVQRSSAVAMDADGDFTVAWQSYISGSYEIRAQRYQGSNPVDVDLFQTDSADPAPVGSPLTYTLSVGNLQPSSTLTGIAAIDDAIGAAIGLRIVDTLPTGVTAVSAIGTNWSCTFPVGKVSCNYTLPLPANEEASNLKITLTPPNTPGEVLNNIGRASAIQFDDSLLNNRDVETTTLVCAESVIQLSASAYTVSESGGSATITATRSGGACGIASVQFDTANGSATAGLDFTDVTGTLTWADGDLANKTFTVPINNDALDEIDERVLISLSSVRGASLGTRSAARLSITDDDASPRINFTSRGQTAPESVGLLTVTVQLSELSGRDVTVPVARSGSATQGSDYIVNLTTLSIPAGSRSASFDVEIVDDSVNEATETAILTLGTPNGATLGSVNPYTITITDDDVAATPTVNFNVATASGSEAIATTVLVQLSAASAQTVTVPYTRSGTATFTTDYTLSLPSPITFNPGEIEKMIVVTPVDDTADEPNENALLTLGTPTNATLGTGTTYRRTIVDNDP